MMKHCRLSWKRQGFTDSDFDGGGSNRFIDAMVAWGGEESIRRRIQEHLDAGADHVVLQSIPWDAATASGSPEKIFELLAPG
jgi:hypothetical protein